MRPRWRFGDGGPRQITEPDQEIKQDDENKEEIEKEIENIKWAKGASQICKDMELLD